MYAYLRKDGRYDTFDVEPKIITADEYMKLQKLKELEARKEQLLTARTNVDAEIAKVTGEIEKLKGLSVSPAEPSAEDSTERRRKW